MYNKLNENDVPPIIIYRHKKLHKKIQFNPLL